MRTNHSAWIAIFIFALAAIVSGCGCGDDDDDDGTPSYNSPTPPDDDAPDDDGVDDDTGDDDFDDDSSDDDVDDDSDDDATDDDDASDDDTGDDDTADDDTSDDDTGDDDTGDDDIEGVTIVFDRADPDFWALPFPSDLHLDPDGTLAVQNFPNPRNSPVIARYLDVGDRDVSGFGTNGATFFQFTGPIDPATLPADEIESLQTASPVFLVSVDPDAADFGARYPLQFKFSENASVYGPPNFLSILPVPGVALLHDTTYAVVLTTDLLDPDGEPLVSNPTVKAALAGTAADAELNALFAPLAGWLTDNGYFFTEIVGATVYTTSDPRPRYAALRDDALTQDLDPIDPGTLSFERAQTRYYDVRGEVEIPIYQQGDPPYLFAGGNIKYDANGDPELYSTLTTRFALSIPKGDMPPGGWPIMVYSHGTGGDWDSFMNSDQTADLMAHAGIAVVSIDAVNHGTRNPWGGGEDLLFYNALNPESFRDNVVQSGVELMVVLRQAADLVVPKELIGISNDAIFDMEYAYYAGHSQGSTVAPVTVTLDPDIRAAFLSGAGAYIIYTMLYKDAPFPIRPLVGLGLFLNAQEMAAELDEFHPALSLVQHLADSVDGAGLNRYYYLDTIDGSRPKHIFQSQGITDTYVTWQNEHVFSVTSGLDVVGDVLLDDLAWRTLLAGGQLLEDAGISGNEFDLHGNPMTAVTAQYPAPEGGQDGHFVYKYFPSLRHRVGCFFKTDLEDGIPTFVPEQEAGSEDQYAPCD
ncbi:hypothetical protein K8I61_12630 [bacterium]|nr:hypothetical protein [bacterium]